MYEENETMLLKIISTERFKDYVPYSCVTYEPR
jgi:hypothetical protein